MVDRIHGGNLRAISYKYGVDPKQVIDFSSNVNSFGPPKVVVDYLSQVNIEDVVNYPDMDCWDLKSALAKKTMVDEKNLLMTNGSSEAITLLANHFCPLRALVVKPTFCEYEIAVNSIGGIVKGFNLPKEDNFALSLNSLIPAINQIDLLFLCNPNNPTGSLYSKDVLIRLLEEADKKGVFVVADEAFMDFASNKKDYSLIRSINDFGNLAILGSLTKFYSLAGLRIGYIASNEVLIKELRCKLPAWNVNTLAQKAALFALGDDGFEQITLRKIMEAKGEFYSALSDIPGLRVYPSASNFLLVEVLADNPDMNNFYLSLLKCGFYVRNCASFSGLSQKFFRVAIRQREENQKLVEAIRKVLSSQEGCL